MRCPSCNKFAGLEMQDPEVEGVDIDADGNITAEVRIVRNSACCGEGMKEYTFSMETSFDDNEPVSAHKGEGHELSAEEDGVDMIEEGGGRYAKSYYGASLTVRVTCTCGKLGELDKDGKGQGITVELSDKVAASEMEEMC